MPKDFKFDRSMLIHDAWELWWKGPATGDSNVLPWRLLFEQNMQVQLSRLLELQLAELGGTSL